MATSPLISLVIKQPFAHFSGNLKYFHHLNYSISYKSLKNESEREVMVTSAWATLTAVNM